MWGWFSINFCWFFVVVLSRTRRTRDVWAWRPATMRRVRRRASSARCPSCSSTRPSSAPKRRRARRRRRARWPRPRCSRASRSAPSPATPWWTPSPTSALAASAPSSSKTWIWSIPSKPPRPWSKPLVQPELLVIGVVIVKWFVTESNRAWLRPSWRRNVRSTSPTWNRRKIRPSTRLRKPAIATAARSTSSRPRRPAPSTSSSAKSSGGRSTWARRSFASRPITSSAKKKSNVHPPPFRLRPQKRQPLIGYRFPKDGPVSGHLEMTLKVLAPFGISRNSLRF